MMPGSSAPFGGDKDCPLPSALASSAPVVLREAPSLAPHATDAELSSLVDATTASKDPEGAAKDEAKGIQLDDLDLHFLSSLLRQEEDTIHPSTSPPGSESCSSIVSQESGNDGHGSTLVTSGECDLGLAEQQEENKSASARSSSAAEQEELAQLSHLALQTSGMQRGGRTEKRRVQLASSSRRQRWRKKNELMALTAEAQLLGEQIDALRLKHKHSSVDGDAAAWHEKAIVQRHKRRQAEDANEQLRRALFLQGGFMRNLKTEFAKSVPGSIQLNMRNFLHTALHLRKDPQSRARDLETACTDSKLDMAIQILLDETETIQPFTTPKFSWQQLDLGTAGLGMTTIAVYAFDSKNACETFKAACNAIVGYGVTWPNYSLVKASVELVELPPTKFDIRYGVTQHLYQSDSSDEQVLLEGREITYYRVGDKYGVFLWDYVDTDDVHPPETTTAVNSCRVGALLVRPELGMDGVERVVCRYICSKIHSAGSSKLTPDIGRFLRSRQLGARAADSLVYEILKGDTSL